MSEVHQIPTRVGRLAVEERGTGDTILLWHSLLATRSMWRHQAKALESSYRLLIVDGPCHGESEPLHRPFTLEDCAAAAVEILDAFGAESAIWVGLSWGGMTAMRAALLAPHRVRALALFDTSAEAEPLLNRLRNQAMATLFLRFGYLELLAPPLRKIMLGRTTLATQPGVGEEVLDHIRACDREALYHAIQAVVIERRSVLGRLPRISVPTLVAVGEEDNATPPPFAERIAAAIPASCLERISRSGHLSALEAPDTVTRLLRSFLAEI